MKNIILEVMESGEPAEFFLRNSNGDFLKVKSSEFEGFIFSCPDTPVQPDQNIITDADKIFRMELERRMPDKHTFCYSHKYPSDLYDWMKQQLLNPKP